MVRSAAADVGVAVLFRMAWDAWAQLVGVLRAGLAAGGGSADPQIARVTPGGLEGLADAVVIAMRESRLLPAAVGRATCFAARLRRTSPNGWASR